MLRFVSQSFCNYQFIPVNFGYTISKYVALNTVELFLFYLTSVCLNYVLRVRHYANRYVTQESWEMSVRRSL